MKGHERNRPKVLAREEIEGAQRSRKDQAKGTAMRENRGSFKVHERNRPKVPPQEKIEGASKITRNRTPRTVTRTHLGAFSVALLVEGRSSSSAATATLLAPRSSPVYSNGGKERECVAKKPSLCRVHKVTTNDVLSTYRLLRYLHKEAARWHS